MSTVSDHTHRPQRWVVAHAGPRPSLYQHVEPVRFTVSNVAFAMFLLVVGTLFLRPTDLIEALAEEPIYEMLIIGAFGLAAKPLIQSLNRRALAQQPVTVCMIGLYVATMISHLSNVYLYGTYEALTEIGKVMIFYFTLITVVNTPMRFRILMMWTAVVGSLMVGLCVIDFLGIVDFKFIVHLVDSGDDFDATGARTRILRMRGTGLFQDPNDLAMVIVACGVLCFYFLNDKSQHFGRFLWLAPMGVLGLGLLLTGSRGGLLATGIAGLALITTRLGRKYAIAAALMAVMALPLAASRQTNVGLAEEGTAYERVLMWREGFAEITSPKVLFGIGWDMYAELAGLVAHNSYIHAFVELGLFGGTFFMGLWFFPLLALARFGSSGLPLRDKELQRAGPYVGAVIAGWCGSMFSLSRCYVPPTYLIVGFGAVYTNLLCLNLYRPQLLIRWDGRHIRLLTYFSLGTFVALYLFVRLIA